jgi:hypothetical protein
MRFTGKSREGDAPPGIKFGDGDVDMAWKRRKERRRKRKESQNIYSFDFS